MDLTRQLIEIERPLWTNDPEIYGATFLPDAVLVFEKIGRMTLGAALTAIREENKAGKKWADVRLDDAATKELAPGLALLTYKAAARWNYEASPVRSFCSTLYLRKEARWRVAFHQQSPL
jgi:hypothetical protein